MDMAVPLNVNSRVHVTLERTTALLCLMSVIVTIDGMLVAKSHYSK